MKDEFVAMERRSFEIEANEFDMIELRNESSGIHG